MNRLSDFKNLQAQTSPNPVGIDIDYAEGAYLYDKACKKYLDMISGIAVTNLGHRHPRVIKAIESQISKYLHVMPYGEFIQEPQLNLAKKLCSILPDGLDVSYFVNSGTEANEAALKLAKRYTGRQKIVSCFKSYHGSTHGSLSVSGNEKKKYNYRPLLPEVYFMRFGEIEDLFMIDRKTAAVIIEPVQGDAGVRIPTTKFMKALRKRCDETGTLLIFDEIQTGFGRTGRFFAFEHFDVVPDILTMAKGMAGGMPMGAFVSSKELMSALSHDPILGHITTFGGHPVCCAAAIATIEVIKEENLLAEVDEKGQFLEKRLEHPSIKEIRRIGLMFAIEFDAPETVYKIVDEALSQGVITFYFLSCPESFRLAPPLTMSYQELEIGATKIRSAIQNTSKR